MKTEETVAAFAEPYSSPAKLLHWTLALLLPVQIGMGWYMLSIEDQPGSGWYFALHISLGLTATLLIALRVIWRLHQAPPEVPRGLPGWQRSAARTTHVLLYVLMLLMPLTGYLGTAFSGEAMSYFGIPLPAWAARYDGLKEQLFTAHSVVAWILVAMIAVHVLAALKHFFIDKDTVFRRMWFYSAAADGTALVTANDR
jgi:cytochrome b561